ncbi:MAG: DNA translocase FtsK [Chloroflexi bacterium]|nr:DNA translocase FtsK [Chloroflexota bacterium]
MPGRFLILALLVGGGAVALVVGFHPAWAIDPLRAAAERILMELGAGVVPIALWGLWVAYLLIYRTLALFRRWRWVLGSAAVIAALQGTLGYVDAGLPLVGTVSLGGEAGAAVQGENTALGYLRVVGLWAASAWVLAPSLVRRVLGRTARGSVQAYRRAPVHRGIGWTLGLAVRQAAAPLRRVRERRRGTKLARELGSFLDANPAPPKEQPEATPEALGEQATAPDPPAAEAEAEAAETPDPPKPEASAAPQAARAEAPRARAAKSSERWTLPSLDLLVPGAPASAVTEEHDATARLIESALAEHSVEVRVAEIRPGPTVTMFGLVPGWQRRRRPNSRARDDAGGGEADEIGNRVRVDAIIAREKDLALALAAPSLRIQAPVPGESVVGIEVPNRSSTTVAIRAVMESPAFRSLAERDGLPVALGLASAGEPVVVDLVDMPHLLIAGATGSGKSVCISSIISSLITHRQPSDLRLMLVDPKRVELTPYNGIPHLVTPVVVEPDRVVRLLRGAVQEMLRRYRLLEDAGVRNIQAYNRSPKAAEHLPYFVICIDELADLMMTSGFDVEQVLCRLAQLGRAIGIHLVVATQRPSVDVVTGLIKANFPSRIAFAVASQVDSRTILDAVGADRLLGRGDMLFLSSDSPKPRRVQGTFVSDEETERLTDHWRQHKPIEVPEVPLEELAIAAEVAQAEAQGNEPLDETDSLYDRALQLANTNGQISTSLLQRRLRIGYPRAARLMDQLQDEGIVAASAEPGKPREVLHRPSG